MESSVDPILQIDQLGSIILVNKACCETFQYSESELIGHNVNMLMPEPYASQHTKYVQTYVKTGEKKVMGKGRRGRKLEGKRKDGSTFPLFLSLSETKVRQGSDLSRSLKRMLIAGKTKSQTTTIFTGILRDLSAEEEEREVLEAMINSCVDPIIVIDTVGIMERANPACSRVFGYTSGELLNNNVSMLMPKHHACQHQKYLEGYLAKKNQEDASVASQSTSGRGAPRSYVVGQGRHVVGTRKDGTEVPMYLSVSEFRVPSSDRHGFIGILRDMSENRRADSAEMERQKSESLLMNVLPKAISSRLRDSEDHESVQIADQYESVTVLFADVVGFTEFASGRSPMQVVRLLNRVFGSFDALADKYHLEKIKTIGDAYMVVSGLERSNMHVYIMLKFAQDMIKAIHDFNKDQDWDGGHEFGIRVGVNAGSVVAGVVGTKRRFFDLWGDSVNVASRMESGGIPNCIQCTKPVAEEARMYPSDFIVMERGLIPVKGKGDMEVFLIGAPGEEEALAYKLKCHQDLRRLENLELHRRLDEEIRNGTLS